MPVRARGAAQIKTIAQIRGSGAHSNERHARQFQIASLELERSRRAHEREAAQNRIRIIEARLVEIDAAIRKHQEALASSDAGAGSPALAPVTEPRPAPSDKRRALRY